MTPVIRRPVEFSYRTRAQDLRRMAVEEFDLVVVGGGITGAGVAHDAAHRGLKVALIERTDFAQGTSSRSSKLIHGGLRYLENMEFGLVFEALSERAHLLRTAPHLVKPLPFFMPVYQGDHRGRWLLSAGLWLYDLLALGRTPSFHEYYQRDRLLAQMPGLRSEGLVGGFKYFDATMWDDVMTIEVARAAHAAGAAVANRLAVTAAHWEGDRVRGVWVEDRSHELSPDALLPGVDAQALCPKGCEKILVRGKRVISCVGPWTDEWGQILANSPGAPAGTQWQPWLKPSKGVHLVFALKRIPVPGCFVMSEEKDGRIAFVIPRPDMGPGVTIVGTTDGPTPADPALVSVEQADIDYLLKLLDHYFPDLGIQASDILSSYAGVRPLFGGPAVDGVGASARALRKVSREHHIAWGPGGSVFVAGGKYTTYRRMAREITLFALDREKGDRAEFSVPRAQARRAGMPECFNPLASAHELAHAQTLATESRAQVPAELWTRYGAAALALMEGEGGESRAGFPRLAAQRRFAVEHEMALIEEDFSRRRSALWAVEGSSTPSS